VRQSIAKTPSNQRSTLVSCAYQSAPQFFFFLLRPRPPTPTLFPYTTLFRSLSRCRRHEPAGDCARRLHDCRVAPYPRDDGIPVEDRKSTRLNSSHVAISYAVFCVKKKSTGKVASCVAYNAQVIPDAVIGAIE